VVINVMAPIIPAPLANAGTAEGTPLPLTLAATTTLVAVVTRLEAGTAIAIETVAVGAVLDSPLNVPGASLRALADTCGLMTSTNV
jgi:hypothetical protein